MSDSLDGNGILRVGHFHSLRFHQMAREKVTSTSMKIFCLLQDINLYQWVDHQVLGTSSYVKTDEDIADI